jgi:hypothetical protein
MAWLTATDIPIRRGQVVLLGLILGVLAGGSKAIHDLYQLKNNNIEFLLQPAVFDDSPVLQAVLITLAVSIWTAGGFGITASAAYRRPVLLGIGTGSFLSSCIALAADHHQGPGPLPAIIYFTTAALGFALLLLQCQE